MHSRFSTNTFPSWELAHPYRMVAHNGEVNTLTGNRNWMRAREGAMRSELLGDELAAVLPVVDFEASDSASIDAVVELLVRAGRSPAHALKLLAPEALGRPRGGHPGGARLHRLPLAADGALGRPRGDRLLRRLRGRRDARPQRPAPRPLAADPRRLGRLRLGGGDGRDRPRRRGPPRPARTGDDPGRRRRDAASCWSTARSSAGSPPATTTASGTPNAPCPSTELPEVEPPPRRPEMPLRERQLAFGYDQEDLKVVIGPLVDGGQRADRLDGRRRRDPRALEPLPSPLLLLQAALRPGHQPGDRPGPRGGRDEPQGGARPPRRPAHRRPRRQLLPAARPAGPRRRRAGPDPGARAPVLRTQTLDATWPREDGAGGLAAALERLCATAVDAVDDGRHDPRPLRPRHRPRPGPDPDRCWRPPPSTTASSAPGAGCAPRSSARPAKRARPTTSPAWSASAPRRSTPT